MKTVDELQKEIDELKARVKLQDEVIGKLVAVPTYVPYVPCQPIWVAPLPTYNPYIPWHTPYWFDTTITCQTNESLQQFGCTVNT